MTHTPGPWHRNIKPARKYCIVFAGRNTHVAAVQSPAEMTDAEIEANCDLIVAAPEMLAALKLVRDFDCKNAPALMALPGFKSMHEAAFTAIAKAEGRA